MLFLFRNSILLWSIFIWKTWLSYYVVISWIGCEFLGRGIKVCSYVYVRKRCVVRRVPKQGSCWRAFPKVTRALGYSSSLVKPLCSSISNLGFRRRCVQGHYSPAKYHCRTCDNLPHEPNQVSFMRLINN